MVNASLKYLNRLKILLCCYIIVCSCLCSNTGPIVWHSDLCHKGWRRVPMHGCHGCYQFYGEKQFYDIPWVCSWFHVISHCLQIKPTRSQVWTLLPGATASPAAHHCVSSRNSYYCHCSDVLRSPRGIEWRPPGGNRGRQEESAPTTGFCLRRSVDWKMFFSGILPPRKRAIKKHRIGFWGIPSFLEAKWVQLLVST